MKLAICFSGHPSCYDYKHHESYKLLFPGHEIDVFAFHWTDWGITPEDEQRYIDIYQPKFCMFHTQPARFFKEWGERVYERRSIGRPNDVMFPMWYAVKQANKLRHEYEEMTGIRYDAVVRARVDQWFIGPWLGALDELDDNKIMIPAEMNFGDHVNDGYNDQLAVGTPAAMDKYCGMYDWFPGAYYAGEAWGNEVMLWRYINRYTNLKVTYRSIPYKLCRPSNRDHSFDEVGGLATVPERGVIRA